MASNGALITVSRVGPPLGTTHFFFRVDHLRSVELCTEALQVACMLLSSGSGVSSAKGRGMKGSASGTFVAKLWAGGEQQPLLADMRSRYSIYFFMRSPLFILARSILR